MKYFIFLLCLVSYLTVGTRVYAQNTRYGIHADLPMPLASQQGLSINEQVALVASTKTKLVRLRVSWSEIEPRPGEYTWGQTDTILSALAAYNLEPLLIIRDTPSWAKARQTCGGTLTPEDTCPPAVEAWNDFLHELVGRYGYGQNGQNQVQFWEIWNEPNGSLMFSGSVDEYFTLLTEAHRTIHARDPNAKVLLGGITHRGILEANGNSWIDQLLAKPGILASFDIFNFHLYGAVATPEVTIPKAQSLLTRYGLSSKPIWITETNPSATSEVEQSSIVANWHERIAAYGVETIVYFTFPNWCQTDTPDTVWCDNNVYSTPRRIGGLVKASDFRQPTSVHAAYVTMVSNLVYLGDTDNDGDVDIVDYNNLLTDFGTTSRRSDLDRSGRVDIRDYATLSNNFGQTYF